MNRIVFLMFFLSLTFSINAQTIDDAFFQKVDQVFKTHVQQNGVAYSAIKRDARFTGLIEAIAVAQFDNLDANTKQAFLINAYNLLVIHGVTKNNLMNSVNEQANFFDAKVHTVGGKKISLNTLEKSYLLKNFGDARFHFALVCGAKGCPPIANFAYMPKQLEQQLETQTKKAINDATFIRVDKGAKKAGLSQIFSWYASDFGGKKSLINYINKYRTEAIPNDFSIDFYEYDWSLNTPQNGLGTLDAPSTEQNPSVNSNNSSRYVVSAAIPKGTTETKIFNNLYTQRTRETPESDFNGRSNFFTTSVSFLYGLTNRFNAGFDLRYRRVSNTGGDTSPFNVFTRKADSRRQGITNIGPKIRWAPTPELPNFSIQSAFWIPTGKDLEGNGEQPYIDWDGATWVTQFFNDFSLGDNFSIFTEIDIWLEDIGKKSEGDLNRFSTPATLIFSYFPNPKTTLYALGSFSPFWQENFDYFAQGGFGAKYQLNPNVEFELSYTRFTNQFLAENNGRANTFNFGVRFSR